MKDKNLDEKIEKALLEGTKGYLDLKDDIWNNIEARIKDDTIGGTQMISSNQKVKDKQIKPWIKYGATAAIFAIVVGVGTDVGQATIKKVKEFLVPQKTIVEELEGNKENTNVNLNESKLGYTIYFDEDRYMIETLEGIERIVPKPVDNQDLSKLYYMEIREVKDKKPEELAKEIKNRLNEEFENVREIEIVNEPVQGLSLRANTLKDNNPLVKYYFVDNRNGGTFIFKQQLTIEAAEGHGVRFDNMLKEFRINE